MTDLLREAIADAKAVKEVALANAKLALEEAFTPRLQSMIASKLAEESDEEMPEDGGMEEEPVEEGDEEEYSDEAPVEEGEEDEESGEGDYGDDDDESMEEGEEGEESMEEPVEDEPVEEGDDEEMDPELQEILRQLEEEADSSDIGTSDNKKPSSSASDDNTSDPGKGDLFEDEGAEEDEVSVEEGEEEEDVDIQEIIRALREEDESEEGAEEAPAEEAPEEDAPVEEVKSVNELKRRLKESYTVVNFLRQKMNEVNLLNSKLLFSNKLFRKYSLSENQKIKVIENFDRAGSVREVKLVYATLAESFGSSNTVKQQSKPRSLKEGLGGGSKPTPSTRPSKRILTESDESTNRFKKLAGIL